MKIAEAMQFREFSQGQRKKMAKEGEAMPGGGFPIANKQDLKNARQAIGRAKNPGAARAHIRKRARALGVKLPGKWSAAMTHKQLLSQIAEQTRVRKIGY